jgi:hypothetical protein
LPRGKSCTIEARVPFIPIPARNVAKPLSVQKQAAPKLNTKQPENGVSSVDPALPIRGNKAFHSRRLKQPALPD